MKTLLIIIDFFGSIITKRKKNQHTVGGFHLFVTFQFWECKVPE